MELREFIFAAEWWLERKYQAQWWLSICIWNYVNSNASRLRAPSGVRAGDPSHHIDTQPKAGRLKDNHTRRRLSSAPSNYLPLVACGGRACLTTGDVKLQQKPGVHPYYSLFGPAENFCHLLPVIMTTGGILATYTSKF